MILEGSQPTNPIAFGEELQRLRKAAGISIDEISAETKISRRILEALESGDFQHLPERVFARSFVNQFAVNIAHNDPQLLADFDAAWARFHEDSGEFEIQTSDNALLSPSIRWGFWFPISVGAVILVSVAVVILSGSEPGQAALVETPRPVVQRQKPQVTPVGARMIPSVVADPIPSTSDDRLVSIVVQVAGDKECWIHYRDREGRTDQHLLRGGADLSLELEGPVKLTIGNAGAAWLVVGGVQYSDLGVPGQVVHTEISHDGVKTLGGGFPRG
jgi:cytoskeletal protein RodZ